MDPRITLTIEQMHAAPDTVDMAALARRVRLSPSRFAHLFRQEAGVPPVQYLRALRMLRARMLIERTFLSIKEVMYLVGCHDPSHFTRDFRRFHGMAPTECRAAAGRRPVGGDGAETAIAGDETAAVRRIAALANDRQKAPTKPSPQEPREALALAGSER